MTSNRSLKIVSEKGTALRTLNEMEAPAMRSEYRRPVFSKRRPVLSRGAASLLAMALMPASFAQNVQPDTITVKNWAVGQSTNPRVVANANAPDLVFIAATPCRVAGYPEPGRLGKDRRLWSSLARWWPSAYRPGSVVQLRRTRVRGLFNELRLHYPAGTGGWLGRGVARR
jgi:hypothetical protein